MTTIDLDVLLRAAAVILDVGRLSNHGGNRIASPSSAQLTADPRHLSRLCEACREGEEADDLDGDTAADSISNMDELTASSMPPPISSRSNVHWQLTDAALINTASLTTSTTPRSLPDVRRVIRKALRNVQHLRLAPISRLNVVSTQTPRAMESVSMDTSDEAKQTSSTAEGEIAEGTIYTIQLGLFPQLSQLTMLRVTPDIFAGMDRVARHLESVSCQRVMLRDLSQLFVTPVVHSRDTGKLLHSLSACSVHTVYQWNADDLESESGTTDADTSLHWPSLQTIDVSHNTLATLCERTMRHLTTCTRLDVSHNSISSLPDGLVHLFRLHTLSFANNLLMDVQRAPLVLGSVVVLDLSGNQLVETKGLEKLWALQQLDLSANCISNVAELVRLSQLPELIDLRIRGNPVAEQATTRRTVFAAFGGARAMALDLDGSTPTLRERIALRWDSGEGATQVKHRSEASAVVENASTAEAIESAPPATTVIPPIFTVPNPSRDPVPTSSDSHSTSGSTTASPSTSRLKRVPVRNAEISGSPITPLLSDDISLTPGASRRRMLLRVEPTSKRMAPVVHSSVESPSSVRSATVSPLAASSAACPVPSTAMKLRKQIDTTCSESGNLWLNAYRDLNATAAASVANASTPVASAPSLHVPSLTPQNPEEGTSIKRDARSRPTHLPAHSAQPSPIMSRLVIASSLKKSPSESVVIGETEKTTRTMPGLLPPLDFKPSPLLPRRARENTSTTAISTTTLASATLADSRSPRSDSLISTIGPFIVDVVTSDVSGPLEVVITASELVQSTLGVVTTRQTLDTLFAITSLPLNTLRLEFRRSPKDVNRIELLFRSSDKDLSSAVLTRLRMHVDRNERAGIGDKCLFRYRCMRCANEITQTEELNVASLRCSSCFRQAMLDISPDGEEVSDPGFRLFKAEHRSIESPASRSRWSAIALDPALAVYFQLQHFTVETESTLCWIPCAQLLAIPTGWSRKPAYKLSPVWVLVSSEAVFVFHVGHHDELVPGMVVEPEVQLRQCARMALADIVRLESDHQRQLLSIDLRGQRPITLALMDTNKCSYLMDSIVEAADSHSSRASPLTLFQDTTDRLREMVVQFGGDNQPPLLTKVNVLIAVWMYVVGVLRTNDEGSAPTSTLLSRSSSWSSTYGKTPPGTPSSADRRRDRRVVLMAGIYDRMILVDAVSDPGSARVYGMQLCTDLRVVTRLRRQPNGHAALVSYGLRLAFNDGSTWTVDFPSTANVEMVVNALQRCETRMQIKFEHIVA